MEGDRQEAEESAQWEREVEEAREAREAKKRLTADQYDMFNPTLF